MKRIIKWCRSLPIHIRIPTSIFSTIVAFLILKDSTYWIGDDLINPSDWENPFYTIFLIIQNILVLPHNFPMLFLPTITFLTYLLFFGSKENPFKSK